MNKDKVIKDLKERNDILSNQYMQEQARNYHLNYVIENDLKPTLKGYEYEISTNIVNKVINLFTKSSPFHF